MSDMYSGCFNTRTCFLTNNHLFEIAVWEHVTLCFKIMHTSGHRIGIFNRQAAEYVPVLKKEAWLTASFGVRNS